MVGSGNGQVRLLPTCQDVCTLTTPVTPVLQQFRCSSRPAFQKRSRRPIGQAHHSPNFQFCIRSHHAADTQRLCRLMGLQHGASKKQIQIYNTITITTTTKAAAAATLLMKGMTAATTTTAIVTARAASAAAAVSRELVARAVVRQFDPPSSHAPLQNLASFSLLHFFRERTL